MDLHLGEPDARVEREQAHVEVVPRVARVEQLAAAKPGHRGVLEGLVVAVARPRLGRVEAGPRLEPPLDPQHLGRAVATGIQLERHVRRQVAPAARAQAELDSVGAHRHLALEDVYEVLEPGRHRRRGAAARLQGHQVLAEARRRVPGSDELVGECVAQVGQAARIAVLRAQDRVGRAHGAKRATAAAVTAPAPATGRSPAPGRPPAWQRPRPAARRPPPPARRSRTARAPGAAAPTPVPPPGPRSPRAPRRRDARAPRPPGPPPPGGPARPLARGSARRGAWPARAPPAPSGPRARRGSAPPVTPRAARRSARPTRWRPLRPRPGLQGSRHPETRAPARCPPRAGHSRWGSAPLRWPTRPCVAPRARRDERSAPATRRLRASPSPPRTRAAASRSAPGRTRPPRRSRPGACGAARPASAPARRYRS